MSASWVDTGRTCISASSDRRWVPNHLLVRGPRAHDVAQLRPEDHFMPVHRLDPGTATAWPTPAGESTPLSGSTQPRQRRQRLPGAAGPHRWERSAPSRRDAAPGPGCLAPLPGHAPWAGELPRIEPAEFRAAAPSIAAQRPDQVRSLRRVIDRQSRRSLVLGGALVIAILGGAGVIAWAAKPAAPQPAFSVDAGNGTGRADSSYTPRNGQSITRDTSAAADPADGLSGRQGHGSLRRGTRRNNGSKAATGGAAGRARTGDSSRLGPGDPGFGWPSTAFGSARTGSGT